MYSEIVDLMALYVRSLLGSNPSYRIEGSDLEVSRPQKIAL